MAGGPVTAAVWSIVTATFSGSQYT
jgi:hypothetical protein